LQRVAGSLIQGKSELGSTSRPLICTHPTLALRSYSRDRVPPILLLSDRLVPLAILFPRRTCQLSVHSQPALLEAARSTGLNLLTYHYLLAFENRLPASIPSTFYSTLQPNLTGHSPISACLGRGNELQVRLFNGKPL